MRNIKLEIEYDGTNYCGWQIQNSSELGARSSERKSIQEVIEGVLYKILQEKIRLISSGRTDAGVHALGQVANFKTDSGMPLDKLQSALNGLLPADIKVKRAEDADLSFHSRFQAKSKVYRYTILNAAYPAVFLKDTTCFYSYPLNVSLMRKEARCLLGRNDFKAFCASASTTTQDTVRDVKYVSIRRLSLESEGPSLIVIDIEADGFLYNMVRNIAGTLIEIGRGRFPAGSLKMILKSKDRKRAGPTAVACGLCLMEVKY